MLITTTAINYFMPTNVLINNNTDMFLLRRLVGCLVGQLDEMVELIEELLAGGVNL